MLLIWMKINIFSIILFKIDGLLRKYLRILNINQYFFLEGCVKHNY